MHLMTFMQIARPSTASGCSILLAQGVFYNAFFLLYLISPGQRIASWATSRRRRVYSYTEYLAGVDDGTYANVPAPAIAIAYWKLAPGACLREVIVAVSATTKPITAT